MSGFDIARDKARDKGSDKAHDKERLEAALLLTCLRAHVLESGECVTPDSLSGVDWNAFLRLAIRHRMVPAVRHVLEPSADSIPLQAWENIRDAALGIAVANERWMAEQIRLYRALQDRGIAVMPQRGLILSQQLYGDIHSRQVSDIDLLVRPKDAEAAMNLLAGAGYEPMFRLDAMQTRAFVQFRTERAFIQPSARMTVDLHWRALPNVFSFVSDEDLWREAQTIEVGGIQWTVPCDTHQLLLVCAHGNKHGWDRFAQVLDLAMSVRGAAPTCVREAMEIAVAAGNLSPFVFGLLLCRELTGVDIPDEAHASSLASEGIREVRRFLLDPDVVWGRGGQERKLLRYLLERVFDRVRYYADVVLTPTGIEIEKVSLPRPLWFLYYVIRAARLAGKAARGRTSG